MSCRGYALDERPIPMADDSPSPASSPASPAPPASSGGVRLESWKEVAAYLHRTVRTVQRWEREQGLPVHRLKHNRLASIYAYPEELDRWWEARRLVLEATPNGEDEGTTTTPTPVSRALYPEMPSQGPSQGVATRNPWHSFSVWKVAEVTTTGPNGATNSAPQPGYLIVTGKHYAEIRVKSDKPRPDLPPGGGAKASADELRAVWGNTFAANMGTFEIDAENLVTRRQLVAKNPAAMAPGQFQTFTFKHEGDTLWITQVGTQAGPVPNPGTTKFVRVE